MWNKLLQQSRCFFCSRTETHQPSDLIRKQLLKLCAVRGASGWETRSIIHSNAGIISLQFIRVRWAERISLLIEWCEHYSLYCIFLLSRLFTVHYENKWCSAPVRWDEWWLKSGLAGAEREGKCWLLLLGERSSCWWLWIFTCTCCAARSPHSMHLCAFLSSSTCAGLQEDSATSRTGTQRTGRQLESICPTAEDETEVNLLSGEPADPQREASIEMPSLSPTESCDGDWKLAEHASKLRKHLETEGILHQRQTFFFSLNHLRPSTSDWHETGLKDGSEESRKSSCTLFPCCTCL